MPRLLRASCFALAASLSGCGEELPVVEEEVALELADPSPLAEVLYGGELGQPIGDRVRLLVWLSRMDLPEAQLAALAGAGRRVAAEVARVDAAVAAAGMAEAELLAPLYAELEAALLSGGDVAGLAERIAAARDGLEDPRALRAAVLRLALAEAGAWVADLDEVQAAALVDALFVLRSEVGVGSSPGTIGALLGTPWPAEDFATLVRSADAPPLDLDVGGLWSLDGGDPRTAMEPVRREALVALVLLQPELVEACEAWRLR